MVHFLLHDFDKKEKKKFKKKKKWSQAFLIGHLCWRSSLPKPQVFVPGAGSRGVWRDRSSHGCGGWMQPERARLPSSDSGLVLEQLRLGSLLGPVPWKEPAGTPPDKTGTATRGERWLRKTQLQLHEIQSQILSGALRDSPQRPLWLLEHSENLTKPPGPSLPGDSLQKWPLQGPL